MPRNISTLHFAQVGRSSTLGLIVIAAWVDTSPAIFPSVRFPTNSTLGFVVGHLPCNKTVIRMQCQPEGRRAVSCSGYMDRSARHPIIKKSDARVENRTDAFDFSQPYLGGSGAVIHGRN